MLKNKLPAAVEELKKVYTNIKIQPGKSEGQIDIALEPSGLRTASGELAFMKIIAAQGLQCAGYVFVNGFKTLFLRDISEVAPAVNQQSEISDQQ